MKSVFVLFLDLFSGVFALAIVYIVSTYITSSEVLLSVSIAVVFMITGFLRGNTCSIPGWIRVIIITLAAILYLPLTGDLGLNTIPYPVIAVIFTIAGFIARKQSMQAGIIKKLLVLVVPLALFVIISLLFLPKYFYHVNTFFNVPAPEFEIHTFNGQIIKSSDLKGKVILIDFWSSNCAPCIAFMPKMETLYAKYKDNPNVAIICLNPGWESFETAHSFLEKHPFNLPFAYDENSRTANLLHVYGNPSTVIIDRDYHIRIKHLGYSASKDIISDFSYYIEKFLQ